MEHWGESCFMWVSKTWPSGRCCFGSWPCYYCHCRYWDLDCWLSHRFYSLPLLSCPLFLPHIWGKRPGCIYFEDPALGTSSQTLTEMLGWADPGCQALWLQGTSLVSQMGFSFLNKSWTQSRFVSHLQTISCYRCHLQRPSRPQKQQPTAIFLLFLLESHWSGVTLQSKMNQLKTC